jgi:hypothetical protein
MIVSHRELLAHLNAQFVELGIVPDCSRNRQEGGNMTLPQKEEAALVPQTDKPPDPIHDAAVAFDLVIMKRRIDPEIRSVLRESFFGDFLNVVHEEEHKLRMYIVALEWVTSLHVPGFKPRYDCRGIIEGVGPKTLKKGRYPVVLSFKQAKKILRGGRFPGGPWKRRKSK